jgi:transcriptional regulator with GAF, ATPase, and Fis domain
VADPGTDLSEAFEQAPDSPREGRGRSPARDLTLADLEEQLALERFIAELSGQFINVPTEQVDDAIRNGLHRACELLGLDRATFVRIAPDGTVTRPLGWTQPGVEPIDTDTVVSERFPWTLALLRAGETAVFSRLDEIPDANDRASYEAVGTQSSVSLPLSVEGRVTAVVGFCTVHTAREWTPALMHSLTAIASVFAQAVARQQRDEALQAVAEEAQRLKDRLQVENVYLRQEARQQLGQVRIAGQSAALRRVLDQIEQVAMTDSTVLLLGETGTGKELFATDIHEMGPRRARPMVRVNCAAIPATLIESELFGREKGAFTGALSRQVGRFELADHSTIFLDEIGDLPLDVQVKLLRVLEERKIERLGSPRPIAVDTRIIAATHHNLEQRVAEGAFREDLYYRLNVFPIRVPPLRERVEDIPLLVWRFVEEFSRAFGKRIDSIDRDTLAALQRHSWPGNIRELRNVIERAMIVTTSRRLTITLPPPSAASTRRSPKLVDVEKEHIRAVLESAAWRIRGAGGAAARLGMKPTTLETRMAKLGLKRPGRS